MLTALGAVTLVVLLAPSAHALSAEPSPIPYYPPLYVTAFQTGDGLDAIELHNDTDTPVDTTNWKIVASDEFGPICEIILGDYVLPDRYVTIAKVGLITDQAGNIRTYDECKQPERIITSLTLYEGETLQESIGPFVAGAYVRKNTTKTYRTGQFDKDFTAMSPTTRQTLYADPWYQIPLNNPLQITEIMAHAAQCAPLDDGPACGDYVKLYNPTTDPVDVGLYRLRSGYQGQSATSGNTFALAGILEPGHFAVIKAQSDGAPLSLTNSGGWVWFEDSQGLKRYDTTVTSYADAGSTTKIGWAWAYDETDGTWKWTSQPTPYDQPSVFVLPPPEPVTPAVSSLKPCASNQYRSPETNRCRLKAAATSALKPCAADQYRSSETNRCRSLTSASTALSACAPGKFRNPLTNRCKSTVSLASSLQPCAANQVRNPSTNRCRKVVADTIPTAAFPVKAVQDSGEATLGWWAFGGAGTLALGYAGWEWRYEVVRMIRRVGQFFLVSK